MAISCKSHSVVFWSREVWFAGASIQMDYFLGADEGTLLQLPLSSKPLCISECVIFKSAKTKYTVSQHTAETAACRNEDPRMVMKPNLVRRWSIGYYNLQSIVFKVIWVSDQTIHVVFQLAWHGKREPCIERYQQCWLESKLVLIQSVLRQLQGHHPAWLCLGHPVEGVKRLLSTVCFLEESLAVVHPVANQSLVAI